MDPGNFRSTFNEGYVAPCQIRGLQDINGYTVNCIKGGHDAPIANISSTWLPSAKLVSRIAID